jgi:hypothetical protein
VTDPDQEPSAGRVERMVDGCLTEAPGCLGGCLFDGCLGLAFPCLVGAVAFYWFI